MINPNDIKHTKGEAVYCGETGTENEQHIKYERMEYKTEDGKYQAHGECKFHTKDGELIDHFYFVRDAIKIDLTKVDVTEEFKMLTKLKYGGYWFSEVPYVVPLSFR